MREIEFRALTNSKVEVKGYYVYDEHLKLHYIDTGRGVMVEINPDTLGQYIGIKDVCKRKVFQGDIVKVREIIYENCKRKKIDRIDEYIGEVVCHQYGWHIAEKLENGTRYHSLWLWNINGENDDTMEILGNRWDTPKLLEIKGVE